MFYSPFSCLIWMAVPFSMWCYVSYIDTGPCWQWWHYFSSKVSYFGAQYALFDNHVWMKHHLNESPDIVESRRLIRIRSVGVDIASYLSFCRSQILNNLSLGTCLSAPIRVLFQKSMVNVSDNTSNELCSGKMLRSKSCFSNMFLFMLTNFNVERSPSFNFNRSLLGK